MMNRQQHYSRYRDTELLATCIVVTDDSGGCGMTWEGSNTVSAQHPVQALKTIFRG